MFLEWLSRFLIFSQLMAAKRHNLRDASGSDSALGAGNLSPLVQNLRDVADDADHGIRQRRFVGDADALAHALKSASDAGVPEATIEELATTYFRSLIDDAARARRRPWARSDRSRGQLPVDHPKELPWSGQDQP